jgi:hypothetical protein
LEIWSTYFTSYKNSPISNFQATTNNKQQHVHNLHNLYSPSIFNLQELKSVWRCYKLKSLKFVLQISRLAAALFDAEQTFPSRFFQEKHSEISVRGVLYVCNVSRAQSNKMGTCGTWKREKK